MDIFLQRDVFDPGFTLGRVAVDGKDFGFSCEDVDRGLTQSMTEAEIAAVKVRGRTAIPAGHYRVLRTWSPKYQRDMMLVADVPGFRGIRIHSGNDADDTEGCLLLGLQRDALGGRVLKSRAACAWLDEQVEAALGRGEDVWLTVESCPSCRVA